MKGLLPLVSFSLTRAFSGSLLPQTAYLALPAVQCCASNEGSSSPPVPRFVFADGESGVADPFDSGLAAGHGHFKPFGHSHFKPFGLLKIRPFKPFGILKISPCTVLRWAFGVPCPTTNTWWRTGISTATIAIHGREFLKI